MKNLSIISCLSPYKNLKLIEAIGSEKVKEIMSDHNSDNLLPTILLPSNKIRILLLENGLFDLEMKTPLLQQLNHLQLAQEFGIKIESLYLYDSTDTQVKALITLADRILEMNAN